MPDFSAEEQFMADRKWIIITVAFLLLIQSLAFSEEKPRDAAASVNKVPKPRPVPQQNIDKVQKQLGDMLAANQRLQEDYMKRIEKMKAISEQARIHQSILDKIKNQNPSDSAVQQAVQQEKIRLIAEQARKNQELLKALRSGQQKTS